MAVDAHDNIWFSDFYHHRLGMLDQKTGTFKMYQPPTRGAADMVSSSIPRPVTSGMETR
jgi:streptogramin lyase